jgi:tetratricopeptide (TPR) repeat protein
VICCCLLSLLIAAPAAASVPVPAAAKASRSQKDEAAAAYLAGVSLVYRGKRLEEAAQKLGEAVRLEPQNGEYRLALGCALVRRAAVLRWAYDSTLLYEKQKASYPQRRAAWEKGQTDPKSVRYGANPPLPPSRPTTVDDGKLFTLTPAQAKEAANDLVRRALKEWDASLAIASADAERANRQYVRGWGMLVAWRIAREFVENPAGSPTFGQRVPWLDPKLVSGQQIIDAFQDALAAAPNNAKYWQSLGDAYMSNVAPGAGSREKAFAAYEKALTLDRRNAKLWYWKYTQQQSDPAAAAAAIGQAASVDPSNSFYWYLLADLLLKRSAGEKVRSPDLRSPDLASGFDALEKGNAGTMRPVTYPYAVPKILAPLDPKDTGVGYGIDGDYIYMLPRSVAAAVDAYLVKGDTASGVSAARAGVRFTEKIAAFAETQTDPVILSLAWEYVGSATETSYSSLVKALERAGDIGGAEEARAKGKKLADLARLREQRAIQNR